MKQSQHGQAGLTWLELLAVLVIIVLVAGVIAVLLPLVPMPDRPPRPSCQNNLKQLGLVMKMYSGESKGELFPRLAPYAHLEANGQGSPRFAVFDVRTVLPEYLTDVEAVKCPTDPDTAQGWWDKKLGRAPDPDAFHALQESARAAGDAASLAYYQTAELARSYVYLGYAVKVVPEFHGWLGATGLLPVTGHVQVAGVGEVSIKDFSKDLPVEPAGWPTWLPFPDRDAGMKALDSSYEVTTLPTVYRLREGIERYFIIDINGPNAPSYLPSALPVLWDAYGSRTPGGPVDKFNHEPAGSNVLFMDGHVEFIDYLGKYPILSDRVMTDYFGQQGQG